MKSAYYKKRGKAPLVIAGKAVGAWWLLATNLIPRWIEWDLASLLRSNDLFPILVFGDASAMQ